MEKQGKTPRSSERLQKKASRIFVKPTRESVLDKIESSPCDHNLSGLRPRKIINEFVKVRNRYNNREDLPESESSSTSDFIDDDDIEISPRAKRQQNSKRRSKVFRLSESSSDEDEEKRQVKGSRSSERIRRRPKKVFHKPSKEEVMKQLTEKETPEIMANQDSSSEMEDFVVSDKDLDGGVPELTQADDVVKYEEKLFSESRNKTAKNSKSGRNQNKISVKDCGISCVRSKEEMKEDINFSNEGVLLLSPLKQDDCPFEKEKNSLSLDRLQTPKRLKSDSEGDSAVESSGPSSVVKRKKRTSLIVSDSDNSSDEDVVCVRKRKASQINDSDGEEDEGIISPSLDKQYRHNNNP